MFRIVSPQTQHEQSWGIKRDIQKLVDCYFKKVELSNFHKVTGFLTGLAR
jgi:hypothetical protein